MAAIRIDQIKRHPPPRRDPDFTQSGNVQVSLPALAPGTRVQQASMRVTGVAFRGLLQYLSGVNITASPVVYDANGNPQSSAGTAQAFLVDFTGIRSLLGLDMLSGGSITLVLPWLGTAFASQSVYPAAAGNAAKPDPSGSSSVGFAGIETSKVLIQIQPSGGALSAEAFAADCRIITSTFPSNLRASLNGRPPFFGRPGILNGSADITGLTDDWNALLANTAAAQPAQVTIATDTPGVLQVQFDSTQDLNAQLSALARFGGQPSQDLNLTALASPQSISLSFPRSGQAAWDLQRLELDLAGQFPLWRSFAAQQSDGPGAAGLRVNAQFTVARRFPFAQDGDLFGFSLLFRTQADAAQLHLELAPDQDGQPGAPPAAAADFAVPDSNSGPLAWVEVLFASLVKISAQKNTWLVLRVKTGSAEWAATAMAADPTMATLLNNDGGAWRAYPLIAGLTVVPLLRVLRRPFSQENQPLLTFTCESQTAQADLVAGAASLAIDFSQGVHPQVTPDGSECLVPLDVTALASGTLTIRKAQLLYSEATS